MNNSTATLVDPVLNDASRATASLVRSQSVSAGANDTRELAARSNDAVSAPDEIHVTEAVPETVAVVNDFSAVDSRDPAGSHSNDRSAFVPQDNGVSVQQETDEHMQHSTLTLHHLSSLPHSQLPHGSTSHEPPRYFQQLPPQQQPQYTVANYAGGQSNQYHDTSQPSQQSQFAKSFNSVGAAASLRTPPPSSGDVSTPLASAPTSSLAFRAWLQSRRSPGLRADGLVREALAEGRVRLNYTSTAATNASIGTPTETSHGSVSRAESGLPGYILPRTATRHNARLSADVVAIPVADVGSRPLSRSRSPMQLSQSNQRSDNQNHRHDQQVQHQASLQDSQQFLSARFETWASEHRHLNNAVVGDPVDSAAAALANMTEQQVAAVLARAAMMRGQQQ